MPRHEAAGARCRRRSRRRGHRRACRAVDGRRDERGVAARRYCLHRLPPEGGGAAASTRDACGQPVPDLPRGPARRAQQEHPRRPCRRLRPRGNVRRVPRRARRAAGSGSQLQGLAVARRRALPRLPRPAGVPRGRARPRGQRRGARHCGDVRLVPRRPRHHGAHRGELAHGAAQHLLHLRQMPRTGRRDVPGQRSRRRPDGGGQPGCSDLRRLPRGARHGRPGAAQVPPGVTGDLRQVPRRWRDDGEVRALDRGVLHLRGGLPRHHGRAVPRHHTQPASQPGGVLRLPRAPRHRIGEEGRERRRREQAAAALPALPPRCQRDVPVGVDRPLCARRPTGIRSSTT